MRSEKRSPEQDSLYRFFSYTLVFLVLILGSRFFFGFYQGLRLLLFSFSPNSPGYSKSQRPSPRERARERTHYSQ